MRASKRITVDFEPALHTAIRLMSARTQRPVSEIINDAVRELLRDDLEDLTACDDRGAEPVVTYDVLVRRLKRAGKI